MNMPTRALFGPQIKYNSTDAQRQQQLAHLLLKEGANTSPAQGGIGEVLARIGTAGIGGYLSNQAGETEKAYQSDRAKTLAQALSMGQDQPAQAAPTLAGGEAAATRGMGFAQQGTKGDPMKVAQMLMANPSTADMGAQLALGQMQFNRDRSAKKEDVADERQYQTGVRQEERGWKLEDIYANQNFQREMAGINQAFQAGQIDRQQAFQAAQMAAQQAFQGQQNQLNRDAQAAQAQAAAALAKVPQGYQVSPDGGVQPIPGSPQATEAADLAKSKAESGVSVERMIRSIDELAAHPGLEGTVGFSVGQRYIPGTDAASFDARLETLKSQAFLPMVAQLKGMGQLSDAEGKKLTAAIGALDPRMSEEEFKASMDVIRSDMNSALERMGGKPIPKPSGAKGASGGLPALPPGFTVMP